MEKEISTQQHSNRLIRNTHLHVQFYVLYQRIRTVEFVVHVSLFFPSILFCEHTACYSKGETRESRKTQMCRRLTYECRGATDFTVEKKKILRTSFWTIFSLYICKEWVSYVITISWIFSVEKVWPIYLQLLYSRCSHYNSSLRYVLPELKCSVTVFILQIKNSVLYKGVFNWTSVAKYVSKIYKQHHHKDYYKDHSLIKWRGVKIVRRVFCLASKLTKENSLRDFFR